MRPDRYLVIAVASLILIALGAPAGAGAGHEGVSKCAIVSDGPSDYRVRSQNMKCTPAERGAKRFLRRGQALSGFTCTEADERTPFFCKRNTQAYWAVLL